MSVLIKGMEMPLEKSRIIQIYPDGTVRRLDGSIFNSHFEAVPVPPHGDLIDRDPFVQFIKSHWDSSDQWFVEQLEARPTIIPAEEGET